MKQQILLFSIILFSITGYGKSYGNGHNRDSAKRGSPHAKTGNGNESLGQTYLNQNICGLNYVSATVMTQTRSLTLTPPVNTNGTGFPTALTIVGLPCGGPILKAYAYWDASFTENKAPAASIVITNPSGTVSTTAATIIGRGTTTGWNNDSNAAYRADITTSVNVAGNGSYKVNITGFAKPAYEIDGVTIIIIYTDPKATYSGSIAIWDGCQNNSALFAPYYLKTTYSGFTVCAATTNTSAFVAIGDAVYGTNNPSETKNELNGIYGTFPEGFWQLNVINNVALTAGQTTTTDAVYTNDDTAGSVGSELDNFVWVVNGLYWQNTTCVTCTPIPLSATITATNAACAVNDGTATVTATGGITAYTYSWSPGGQTTTSISGLGVGTYTVKVTDACGDVATADITISQPSPVTVTVSIPTEVLCNGGNNGSETVTGGGGNAPYTYSWNPSGQTTSTATGLSAGTYTVTVTNAAGCSTTTTVTIVQPALLTATIGAPTNVLCNGGTGSATVTATGGTVPYTYAWAPSGGNAATGTGLSAGTYTVTVTDKNGCVSTATTTITQPPLLTVTTTMTQATCGTSNGTATATVTGGTTPYTYAWTPGGGNTATINNISAGTYTCTVTDKNNCIATSIIVVTNIGGPSVSITASTNVLCNGGANGSATSAVTGGSTPYTYVWTPSGGNTNTATGLSAGTYTIIVKDANGCTSAATVTITQPTKITSTTSFTPASCNLSNGSATVIAANGTPTYKYLWTPSGETTATATGIPIGTYTITITDNNGCTQTNTVTVTQPSAVKAIISGTTPTSCNGGNNGTATATATGGTAPYTYAWTPIGGSNTIANGLSAGTYTVTVTDKTGCVSTATAVVAQPTVVTTTIGVPTNVLCNGGNNGSATATTTGGTAPYTYTWAPSGGNTATGTGLSAGTYTVNVTDKNGCTASATIVITQPVLLTESTTMTQATCGSSNGSATASASGGTAPYKYSWAPIGGNNATANGLSAGTYTATVTDKNNCTAISIITVTNIGAPTVTITASTNILCNGSNTGSATASVNGGVMPYTYAWAPIGGTNATGTGLSAGTYTITLKDANGCISAATVTITQPPLLTVTTTMTQATCGGSNGTATATVTGGTAPYIYSWAPAGGNGAVANGLSAATYTVTVTDKNNCIATSIIVVTNAGGATVTISAFTNVLCNGGNTGTATSTVTGGATPYTYSWAPAGGTKPSASGLTAGTYTLTLQDANGCKQAVNVTITQPTPLGTTTSFIAAYCNLPNGSATVNVTGGTAPYHYVWNPSGQTTATATGLAVGTYTVGVADNNGCTTSNTVTVTQPSAVLASIIGTTGTSCNGGDNGSATASANGGTAPYTYVWAPIGGSSIIANGLSAGTYTILVTDASGCKSTAVAIVTQPPLLTVGITGPLNLCAGASGTLTATPTGGTAPYTYAWSPGIASSASSVSVTPASATTYTVIVTDANGCKATNVFTVSIGSLLSVSITGAASVCQNTAVTLCANAAMGTGGNVYTWQPGNYVTPCITVTPSVTTTYTVTVVDNCGTTATSSAIIQVNPRPDVLFYSYLNKGCIPLCIQFYNTTTMPDGSIPTAYDWQFGDGNSFSSQSAFHCYPDSGFYTVILTVTSDSGCSATLKQTNMIHAFGLPKANFSFSPQPAYISSPTIQFTDQTTDPPANGGIAYWTWNFGDHSDSLGTTQNPTHTYPDTGTYCPTLAVMDYKGCTDTVTNCLVIDPIFTLYIPNAFTPNADGLNDLFLAKGTFVRDFQMYIFDRWGELLFHSTDINKGWNGTVKGGTTISQEDVYVYKILATDWQNHQHSYIGSVSLLK